jgi:serine/threonine-protein kinase
MPVRPFPPTAGAGKWQVSTGGGRFPIWSRTSKELFYASHSPARIMAVSYTAGDTFSPGAPRQWSETAIQFTDHYPPLDLAPDGKRFVVFLAPESASGGSTTVHVNFLLNFFDELKRRVP